ncbi:hypothetical protein SDC9_175614 [bioreactor metagenome]|uniref:Uncharacterized protein n=1 Tax=bioreactor metagenome TaxID=1076179 RepID=A0A645GN74_9ZZZZ
MVVGHQVKGLKKSVPALLEITETKGGPSEKDFFLGEDIPFQSFCFFVLS